MGTVNELAVIVYQSRNSWWSRNLLNLGLIDKPLDGDNDDNKVKVIPKKPSSGTGSGRSSRSSSEEEPDLDYLKSLCPTKWKEQDHYKVLGLGKKRFTASEDDVRKRYRKMLLKHHPDKRGAEVVDRDDDYFACITKAFDILGDPVKRRSYDSVDPTFDDDIPPVSNNSKKNFIPVFAPVFARNARWSTKQPVPLLGTLKSSREDVDSFYAFWYSFDSWREFSYEDEEDKEKGEDRHERRYIEKENRKVRLEKKKNEMVRIRSLVDNAYACDPRVIRFKEEDKLMKEAEKAKKAEARRKAQEEEERRKREEDERMMAEKARQEEEDQRRKEQEKKDKEQAKKKRKVVRKAIEAVVESSGNFGRDHFQLVIDLEKIYQNLSLDQLEVFKENLEAAVDVESKTQIFEAAVNSVSDSRSNVQNGVSSSKTLDQNSNVQLSTKSWSVDDQFLLTKAAKIFPPGTTDRWTVITTYINQHSKTKGVTRKAKEVMAKIKELQDPNASNLKEETKSVISSADRVMTGKDTSNISAAPSERDEVSAVEPVTNRPWTDQEQMLLEQALKTYPKTTDKRWDRIAESIPNRTKEECVKRFKELSEMVKAKKEAMKAAGIKK